MNNLNSTTHILIQVSLFALQFLVPAFLVMTPIQQAAVAAFVSAVQAFIGWSALNTPPPNAAKQQITNDDRK